MFTAILLSLLCDGLDFLLLLRVDYLAEPVHFFLHLTPSSLTASSILGLHFLAHILDLHLLLVRQVRVGQPLGHALGRAVLGPPLSVHPRLNLGRTVNATVNVNRVVSVFVRVSFVLPSIKIDARHNVAKRFHLSNVVGELGSKL